MKLNGFHELEVARCVKAKRSHGMPSLLVGGCHEASQITVETLRFLQERRVPAVRVDLALHARVQCLGTGNGRLDPQQRVLRAAE